MIWKMMSQLKNQVQMETHRISVMDDTDNKVAELSALTMIRISVGYSSCWI